MIRFRSWERNEVKEKDKFALSAGMNSLPKDIAKRVNLNVVLHSRLNDFHYCQSINASTDTAKLFFLLVQLELIVSFVLILAEETNEDQTISTLRI